MRTKHRKLNKASKQKVTEDQWFTAETGIVRSTDDPERMHRVRVELTCIEEDEPHEEWVWMLVPYVGPDGYGSFYPPEVGSEVRVFGLHAQSVTLFAISHYNEEHHTPSEFGNGERGAKIPGDWQLIADGFAKLLAQNFIEIISAQSVRVEGANQVDVIAQVVRLASAGGESVRGEGSKVGFLGASPVARQTLAPNATNLATCIALANSLKVALKNLGLGQ